MYVYLYIGFKTFFYVVRPIDSIASYLPTDLHLGFWRSWPSLFLPSIFSSVFLVLSFVSASTSMLFWVVFLLPLIEQYANVKWTPHVNTPFFPPSVRPSVTYQRRNSLYFHEARHRSYLPNVSNKREFLENLRS